MKLAVCYRQIFVVITLVLLSACGSPYRPPVDELGGSQRFLDAGRTHRVNNGETLYAVAWMYDLDFNALARVNNLREPFSLTEGQMLVIDLRGESVPTVARNDVRPATGVTVNPVQGSGGIQRAQLPGSTLQRTALPESTTQREAPAPLDTPVPSEPVRTPDPVVAIPVAPAAQETPVVIAETPSLSAGPIQWAWPAAGNIVGRFSDSAVDGKGVDISGNKGDAVKAAADGQIVYAGSGLLRYGDLIIIKHNDRFLSAYAHNDRILVKEGSMVKRGDIIAELGSSGIDRNMLHFEIRVEGTPEDPLVYLPAR